MRRLNVENNSYAIENTLAKIMPEKANSKKIRYFAVVDQEKVKAHVKGDKLAIPDGERSHFLVSWALAKPHNEYPSAEKVQMDEVVRIISSCDLSQAVISGLIARDQLHGSLADWDFGAWVLAGTPVDTVISVHPTPTWKIGLRQSQQT